MPEKVKSSTPLLDQIIEVLYRGHSMAEDEKKYELAKIILRNIQERDLKGDNYTFSLSELEKDLFVISIASKPYAMAIDSMASYLQEIGAKTKFVTTKSVIIKSYEGEDIRSIHPCGAGESENSKKGDATLLLMQFIFHKSEVKADEIKKEIALIFESLNEIEGDRESIKVKLNAASELAKQRGYDEISEFIKWLDRGNFHSLNYTEYDSANPTASPAITLGIKSEEILNEAVYGTNITNNSQPGEPLLSRRSDVTSPVLRRENFNCLYFQIDQGDDRTSFMLTGFFDSKVYSQSVLDIPVIRDRISKAIAKHRETGEEYHVREAIKIVQFHPRAELLQMSGERIYDLTAKLMSLSLMPEVKALVHKTLFGTEINVWIFVPKNKMSAKLRADVENMLVSKFSSTHTKRYVQMSESPLAKLFFVLKAPTSYQGEDRIYEEEVERFVRASINSWEDKLSASLSEAGLQNKYKAEAFDDAYKLQFSAEEAVFDLQMAEKTNDTNSFQYNIKQEQKSQLQLRVYSNKEPVHLSSILPQLENLGLKTVSISKYKIQIEEPSSSNDAVFLSYITLKEESRYGTLRINKNLLRNLEVALAAIHYKLVEDDSFHRLISYAELSWRECNVMRAIAKYIQQNETKISVQSMSDILCSHLDLSKRIISLFRKKFTESKMANEELLQKEIKSLRDEISEKSQTSSEESILQSYVDFISATKRTNYRVSESNDRYRPYLSFKIKTPELQWAPLPKPYFEIFVYSNKFEGVHLRGGKIARGGLRWSDRCDYRNEILGLMKAQISKNSIIVPTGAKGGFILKAHLESGKPDPLKSYKEFLSGILDITDNIDKKTKSPIKPKMVHCYDEEHDPYLVVAADKGTAQFSDYANKISEKYNFWLGDAFASGGSNGYNHKELGITAKGAWVLARQHLQKININPDKNTFTVVGIGDMSGDVFGNGMIEFKNIKLVAAFNHAHIFIDPNPNPKTSFNERKALFDSQKDWSEYRRSLISNGGGVFDRKAKFIPITKEMADLLDIPKTTDKLTPNSLISYILKAKVDMIWNGGIGTYAKAQSESHFDVMDKANDELRVNGKEMRCHLFAEGGNLGLTQKARIEYALHGGPNGEGGYINTDSIDNSAGVDCSDHEVNLKLAINALLKHNLVSEADKEKILKYVQKDVVNLVLRNNYLQGQMLDIEEFYSLRNSEDYIWLLKDMAENDGLNTDVDSLPSKEEIRKRASTGQGLTRPELSVIMSHSKNFTKSIISNADFSDDPYYQSILLKYFPSRLSSQAKYQPHLKNHMLSNSIISMLINSDIVGTLGSTILKQIISYSKVDIKTIVNSFVIAKYGLGIDKCWSAAENLLNKIDNLSRLKIFKALQKTIARCMVYLINSKEYSAMVAEKGTEKVLSISSLYSDMIVKAHSKGSLPAEGNASLDEASLEALKPNMNDEALEVFNAISILPHTFRIVKLANAKNSDVMSIAKLYYHVRHLLQIDKLKLFLDNKEDSFIESQAAMSIMTNDIDNVGESFISALIDKNANYVKGLTEVDKLFNEIGIAEYISSIDSLLEDNLAKEKTSFAIIFKYHLSKLKDCLDSFQVAGIEI